MRTPWLFLLAPLIASAQFPPPRLTGVLLERDSNAAAGEFAVRAQDNEVYRFQFNTRTSVDFDGLTSEVSRLTPGERVQVVSDEVSGSLLRYARAVYVLSPVVVPRLQLADTRIRSAARPAGSLLDRILPTGTLTYAGVVSRLNDQRLVLHTRAGEETLLIRRDTRYVDNGNTVEAAQLQPNMRVFIRAGKNLYEQVEAYQVIWGNILEPKRQ